MSRLTPPPAPLAATLALCILATLAACAVPEGSNLDAAQHDATADSLTEAHDLTTSQVLGPYAPRYVEPFVPEVIAALALGEDTVATATHKLTARGLTVATLTDDPPSDLDPHVARLVQLEVTGSADVALPWHLDDLHLHFWSDDARSEPRLRSVILHQSSQAPSSICERYRDLYLREPAAHPDDCRASAIVPADQEPGGWLACAGTADGTQPLVVGCPLRSIAGREYLLFFLPD